MTGEQGSDRRHDTLILAETFVSTQGEGPLSGRRAGFVRLSRCNLTCDWCDTAYTWDWTRFDPREQSRRVAVADVVDWVAAAGVELLVITGGEPLLQQPALRTLCATLPESVRVQVETNATIAPACSRVSLWVASPKLANSGVAQSRRLVPEVLASFAATGCAVFKFVVTDPAEFEEVAAVCAPYPQVPVWVMPEGRTPAEVVAGLAALHDPAVQRGWNVSSRLHVLAGAR